MTICITVFDGVRYGGGGDLSFPTLDRGKKKFAEEGDLNWPTYFWVSPFFFFLLCFFCGGGGEWGMENWVIAEQRKKSPFLRPLKFQIPKSSDDERARWQEITLVCDLGRNYCL